MAEHISTGSSDTEQWKPVVGWEGLYSVSNWGRIRRDRNTSQFPVGRILKPIIDYKGYIRARLSRNNTGNFQSVHVLVAAAFIGLRPDGFQVNHKDTNKGNNHADNLEYVSASENMRHCARAGIHGPAKLTPDDVREVRILIDAGFKNQAIATMKKVNVQTIRNIRLGVAWGHLDSKFNQPIAQPRKRKAS